MISQDCFSADTQYTMIANCCCNIECLLRSDAIEPESLEEFTITSDQYSISNILIDGNPVSLPYTIGTAGASLTFTICAPNDNINDSFSINIVVGGQPNQTIVNLQTVLTDIVSNISVDFGNVGVGQNSTFPILWNPNPFNLICCSNFSLGGIDAPFSFDPIYPENFQLCGVSSQQTNFIFSPTSIGFFTDLITIQIDECNSFDIEISGNGIEPIAGTSNGQKNKVDQTTRVEACSPRTANNRCQTARTMQTAIRTNARRFGKR